MQNDTSSSARANSLHVARPASGGTTRAYVIRGAELVLDFDPSEAVLRGIDDNLLITFNDGARILLLDFFTHIDEASVRIETPGESGLTVKAFLAEYSLELLREALRNHESGAGEYGDDPGHLLSGLDRLGSLGTFYWGHSREHEEWYQTPYQFRPGPSADFHFSISSGWNDGFAATLFEDGLPHQYLDDHGTGTPQAGQLSLDLTTQNGSTVESFTLSGFPAGTKLFLGDPNAGGQELTPGPGGVYSFTPAEFNGAGVWVLPPQNNSDEDMHITYTAQLNSPNGRGSDSGSFVIPVDAVADKPSFVVGSFNVDYGENAAHTPYNASTPGGIVQLSGEAQFYDLDGSEVFYVIIAIPDRGWSISDWDHSRLLSAEAIEDFWRSVGHFPAEGASEAVDAALHGAFTVGDPNPMEPQYLLLEYDIKSGTSRVFGQDMTTRQAKEAPNAGVSVTMDANGVMHFSVPVKTSTVNADSNLEISSVAVSVERTSGDIEIVKANNVAVCDRNDSVDVVVKALHGRLSAALSMHEDGQPNQNGPSPGPKDESTEGDYNATDGISIPITFAGGDANEFVDSITMGPLPPTSQGVIYFDGHPVSAGQILSGGPSATDDWFDKFSFKPAENWSGDVDFKFSYLVGSTTTGPTEDAFDGSTVLHVDSVADLADGSVTATGRLADGDELEMAVPVSTGDGWAVQSTLKEDSVDITFTVTAAFDDLDGSEEAWIDVELPQGFSIPADKAGEYQLVAEGGKTYVRVPVPDLATLPGGAASLDLTLSMGPSAQNSNSLEVRIVTHEKDVLDTDGHSVANNTATRIITQPVPVHLFPGDLTVKAGWTYEGAETSPPGTQDLTTLGLDPASKTAVGAPLAFALSEGSFQDGSVISIPPDAGSLYLGNALHPGGNGVGNYTVSAADLLSGRLSFVPAAGHSDLDQPIDYSLKVADGRGNAFTVTGTITAVVDAVADVGALGAVSAVEADPGSKTITFSIQATFDDVDGSEKHYVLVQRPTPAWTCEDEHIILTVPVDALGTPLPPAGYNEATGLYTYNDSQAAGYRTFFAVDVTEQSKSGNQETYSVSIRAPEGATDIDLVTGLLSVEHSADPQGHEYDLANNQAFTLGSTHVNFADADPRFSLESAYEDHRPGQNTGDTIPRADDGTITVSLDQAEDFINPAGGDITVQFTFAPKYGATLVGTFTFNGVTYNAAHVSGSTYTVTLPASALPAGSKSFTLRYNPARDGDTDLADLNFSIPIIAGGTGDTGTASGTVPVLVVDAVADKPSAPIMAPVLTGGHTAAQSGGTIQCAVAASFGDYVDGSEQHYLVFDLTSGFAGVDPSSFPDGGGWSVLTGGALPPELAGFADTSKYTVVHVPNAYLQSKGGSFSENLRVTLDQVTSDGNQPLRISAVAVDTPSDGSDVTLDNNVAITQGSANVMVHAITSVPQLVVETAFENDTPAAHLGDETEADGAALSITGMHASEDLTSVTLSFDTAAGSLHSSALGGVVTEGTHDLSNGYSLTCTISGGKTAVVITGTSNSDVRNQVAGLRFVPDADYKDDDVPLAMDCTVVDRDSGLGGSFVGNGATVTVDAVAQKPVVGAGAPEYGDGLDAAYDTVGITATATFRDTQDGSEKHYLLVELKSYFDGTGYDTVRVGFTGPGGAGDTLTPSGSGWLNPSPASPQDAHVNAGSSKTFVRIPVDEAIARHTAADSVPQQVGDFTVTKNTDGSYTVTHIAQFTVKTGTVKADLSDTVMAGGMSEETATPPGGSASGGKEAYQYNNTAYDLADVPVELAVVETTSVTLYWNWMTEQDAPDANQPDPAEAGNMDPSPSGNYTRANGTGIVAVCATSDGAPHTEEDVYLSITYQATYKDADGNWVLPGSIWYQDVEQTPIWDDQDLGYVVYQIKLEPGSTNAVKYNAAPEPQEITDSDLRFIPNPASYNEADVDIHFSASVRDKHSGATAQMPIQDGVVVVDAVADLPVLSNQRWSYMGEQIYASDSREASLLFEAYFPDTGAGGVMSEGQYILIQQVQSMDLTQAFKDAVAEAGYTLQNYPVQEGPDTVLYYRIPAAFFPESPAGSHRYQVSIDLERKDDGGDGVYDEANLPKIIAQAVVETHHGAEPDNNNNTAQAQVPIPPLVFAEVDSHFTGSSASAYEGDNSKAWLGDDDYRDGGTALDLRLVLGDSPTDSGGMQQEQPESGIKFTYDQTRGTLTYNDGTQDVTVPSGGEVPVGYQDTLRFTPLDNGKIDADKDVALQYSVTVRDPASGATKELSGTYMVYIDAVAEQPENLQVGQPAYSDQNGDGMIGFGESATIQVSATFPDYAKDGAHADHYILVQRPGENWTVNYPDADIYTYDGDTYFRIPVHPTGPNVSIPVTLTAPASGSPLVYDNSAPIKITALTVDRDPNKGAPPNGDRELDYTNNWAYAEGEEVRLNYEDDKGDTFYIGPMYENNTPAANQLGPDGKPLATTGGGAVHLPTTVTGSDGNPEDVQQIVLTWPPENGILYKDGVPVAPQGGPYVISGDDLNSVYTFQLPPGYSDADSLTVEAQITTSGGSVVDQSATPVVDAVAQAPTDLNAAPDYGAGNVAAPGGQSVTVNVNAHFDDLDGSETHYVLVEHRDGWQIEGGPYNEIQGPDGKVYYQVPVEPGQINSAGDASVPVVLVPPASGGEDKGDGRQGFTLDVGAMSEETTLSGEEQRDDNNVAYNLGGQVEVITSTAETRPHIAVSDTYAGGDKNGDGEQQSGDFANIWLAGTNQASDQITSVVLTYDNDNGRLLFKNANGDYVDLETFADSTTDVGGERQVTITDPDVISALSGGGSGGSNVVYAPNPGNYSDTDVSVSAQVTVKDRFSSDTHTETSGGTIIVDAVARQPTTVDAKVADSDYANGVPPGTDIPITVTGEFPDLGAPGTAHYLGIQQLTGWNAPYPLPKGVTIQTYEGVTYYVIDVDQYGNGESPALVHNGGNSYTFTMNLPSPERTSDLTNAGTLKAGSVTIVTPSGDGELDLLNNVNVVARDIPLRIGVVETTDVSFTFEPVVEDSDAGSPMALTQNSLNDLNLHNEKVTSTTLTFSGDFTGKANGDVVGTVIYGNQTFAVTLGPDGKARADIDFGPDGYTPETRFSMIWGQATVDGGSGAITVNEYNHTGGPMTVEADSTVVDKASNDTKQVAGQGQAEFEPTADAPDNITATNPAGPVGAGASVSFTVSGNFVDVDGAEQHYLLVQKLPGWGGDYQTTNQGGTDYFMVPVNSRDASASAVVTLTTPDDIGNDSVTLDVSGLSTDGGSSALSSGSAAVTVNVSVVSVTNVTLSMDPIGESSESALSRSTMHFTINGADANDNVSISLPDLKGGRIWDSAAGVYVTEPVVLDGAKAASGDYEYEPPAYASGEFSLSFTATARDADSGASKTFSNTASVEVAPVATPPEDFTAGEGQLPQGHDLYLTLDLEADFPDQDGSETHFFVVSLPDGYPEPEGWTLLDTNDPRAGALTGNVYYLEASPSGQGQLSLLLPDGTPAGTISGLAGAVEKTGGNPAFCTDVFTHDIVEVDINTPPSAEDVERTISGLSGNPEQTVTGLLIMSDAEADPVDVTDITGGTTPVQEGDKWTVTTDNGVLTFNASTGAFSYTTTNPFPASDEREVFTVYMDDGHGDTSSATITVNLSLAAARMAPLSLDAEDSGESALFSAAWAIDDGREDGVAEGQTSHDAQAVLVDMAFWLEEGENALVPVAVPAAAGGLWTSASDGGEGFASSSLPSVSLLEMPEHSLEALMGLPGGGDASAPYVPVQEISNNAGPEEPSMDACMPRFDVADAASADLVVLECLVKSGALG